MEEIMNRDEEIQALLTRLWSLDRDARKSAAFGCLGVLQVLAQTDDKAFNGLKSAIEMEKHLAERFKDYKTAIVHGQMKTETRDIAMAAFKNKEIDILVATTVIEVGIDIPDASVMVIEHAERFGLSQLHQLRGRVGRGGDQSYCILMSGYELSAEAKKRISTMVRTNDGFEIAETDLQLRGPGDLQGTQQSGIIDLRIADIVKDEKILKYARNVASEIIGKDPELNTNKNDILAHHLLNMDQKQQNWGLIS